jgi:D-alanyl-D-alanine carboxypeptidase
MMFRLSSVVGAAGLVAACAQGASSEDLSVRLDAVLGRIYRPGEPGASVRVERRGITLLRKSYGLANLDWAIPVEPTTRFRLGSISKQFTAFGILLLCQDGLVDLKDPISKHLPESNIDATIEHLLTHTSGLPALGTLRGYDAWSRLEIRPSAIVSVAEVAPREFSPGTEWGYSDVGYILLGLLIERVSGQTYEDYIGERIFKPIGMNDSGYDDGVRVLARRAAGYVRTPTGFEGAPYVSMSSAFAAAALVSTVDDLARWDAELTSGRLLSRELLRRAFTPYELASGRSTSYGFGWAIRQAHGMTILEHGGSIEGFESQVIRVPALDVFICVLTNTIGRDPAPDFVATRLLEEIVEARTVQPLSLTASQRHEYAGLYDIGEGKTLSVREIGTLLFLERASGRQREMVALGGDAFHFRTSYSRVLFVRDTTGAVAGLRVRTTYDKEIRGVKVAPCSECLATP